MIANKIANAGTANAGRSQANQGDYEGTAGSGMVAAVDNAFLLCSIKAAAIRTSSAHSGQPKKCSSNCALVSGGNSSRRYFSVAISWSASLWSMLSSLFQIVRNGPKSLQMFYFPLV